MALRFLLLSLVLMAHAAWAAAPLGVAAVYDIYKGPLKIGQIEESYTRDQERYTLVSTTRAVGLVALFNPGNIVISSSGLVNKQGLQPLHFSDRRERHEERNRGAEFDWGARQLTLIEQAQRTPLVLPDRTQDRLSAMYQFMFLSPQAGGALDFPMTNGGKLDDYHFAIAPGELLQTPAGEFTTLYLDSQPKPGENRTEIWLAVQRYNFPVKMRITDPDGSQLLQLLRSLEFKP